MRADAAILSNSIEDCELTLLQDYPANTWQAERLYGLGNQRRPERELCRPFQFNAGGVALGGGRGDLAGRTLMWVAIMYSVCTILCRDE